MVEAKLCKLLGTHRDVVRIVLIKKKKKNAPRCVFEPLRALVITMFHDTLYEAELVLTTTRYLLRVLHVVDIEAVYFLSVDVQHTSSPCGFFMVERYKLYCHKRSTQR